MSQPALICDTGALLDYLVEGAPDHAAFRHAIDAAVARYIPGLVLAELDYFLRDRRDAMRSLVQDLRRGAFLYAPPTDAQIDRAMAVDGEYPELELGLVDGTIVALAEELDIVRLATRDVRDFAVVRLADGRAFDLLVVPLRPRPSRPPRK
ncbi:MAG: PIN domain-containing protein [Deltaproteobacteria bacterium]|nr:PIN domain-containing protein [Deltaproteobacteria bacterium]